MRAANLPLDTLPRARVALLLMMASGFAGLGYQIVWTQQCSLWLGHEAAGVLAVVTAFFGGLAVGALALGARIEQSRHPTLWYAACELLIALWGLALILIMSPCSAYLLEIIGVKPTPLRQWSVAFCGTFLLLLPATVAMGATLPAMERIMAAWHNDGRTVAALYADNTFGAVLGVLATAFWLVPGLGLVRTAAVCIALNLACAAAALIFFSRASFRRALAVTSSVVARQSCGGDFSMRSAALLRLALTGLLGIGYEVLVVRVLSQVEEDTVYTFAMLLAVYLAGSAIGAAVYHRWLANSRISGAVDDRLGDRLLCALALACLSGAASLWADEHLKALALQWFGSSMTAAIAAEAVLALLAFGPPTLAMGALFSHLSARAIESGIGFGRALAANTLGAAAAPLIFGVLLFPSIGPKLALLLIVVGYLALTRQSTWLTPSFYLPAGVALAIALWMPPLAFIDVPEGGHIVSYREGVMAAVSVVEDADGVARLRIDNRQQEGSSSSLRVDARQALLPVLLHPVPRSALFLGLGTGVTASAAARESALQVDAVELLPEVIDASRYFTRATASDAVDSGSEAVNPRLHLIAADARRYVRASDRHYDIIVADNFHPARSGSGALYTVEHFQAVRARLAVGGIFCQWLPLHQLDLATLRSIVQSFMTVYPNGRALVASNSLETPVLGLIGRNEDGGDRGYFDVAALRRHLAAVTPPQKLAALGLDDEFALLGSFVAGPRALKKFAADAPANTDDHPVVAYLAPHITYAPDSLPRDRFIELLHASFIDPDELIVGQQDSTFAPRLAAYWEARNRFIEAGRNVRATGDVRAMLAQVREPLLAVLRISPDFRPAYDPLVMMASRLAQSDSADARALLLQLQKIQPGRFEAGATLRRIEELNSAE